MCMSHTIFLQEFQAITFVLLMIPSNRTGARWFEILLLWCISPDLYILTYFLMLQYVNEANWNWRLMKTILTRCHVYDKERYYVPFDELAPQESQPIKFLRKFMPDYAWCHHHSCWLVEIIQYCRHRWTVTFSVITHVPKFWLEYSMLHYYSCSRKARSVPKYLYFRK